MQSLEAVLRRVAGRGESSQMAGGRTRGETSSSVPPQDEDAGTSQTTRSGRSSRRTRGPRARSPSPEDEEEPPQQQEEEDQEEEDQEEEEEDGQEQDQEHDEEDDDQGGVAGDIPAVWIRGPARLPNRPIPLEQRPIIRPDGKR